MFIIAEHTPDERFYSDAVDVETLAKECSFSVRQLKHHLKILIDEGHVIVNWAGRYELAGYREWVDACSRGEIPA